MCSLPISNATDGLLPRNHHRFFCGERTMGAAFSLVERIELVSEELVHLEHVHLGLLEDGLHLVVAAYLPLVAGVLQLVGLDMLP